VELRPPFSSSDAWLAARRRSVLWAVVAASVLVRLVYFLQLSAGPSLWQHRWDQSDMHFFDRWAREVAAGDILTDQELHPHPRWQEEFARAHFEKHPEEAAALARLEAESGVPAAHLLWNRWYGGKQFHQEPLYPYLVAATYAVAGEDPRWVFLWQMALGVAANVLIFLVARSAFGDTVAALSSLALTFYGAVLLYDLTLLRETLLVLMVLALAHAARRAMDTRRPRDWALAGAACGLAVLLKTVNALFFLLLLGHLAVCHRKTPRALLAPAGAALGAFLLVMLPLAARNLAVGAPLLSATSVGPIGILFTSAADSFEPAYQFTLSRHGPAILGEADGKMLPTLVATLKTHESVWAYLAAMTRRLAHIWHWYEVPDNLSFYYYRAQAPVLWCLPVSFGIVAPLGLAGIVSAALRRERRAAPLYLLVAATFIPLLLFGSTSRYRLPLAVALVPFAAYAVASGVEGLRRRPSRARAAAGALAAIVLLALVHRPLPDGVFLIREADYSEPYHFYYQPELERAAERQDWKAAARVLQSALDVEPPCVAELGPARKAATEREKRLGALFEWTRLELARVLARLGREEEAMDERRRAKELSAALGG
jgi:4-amino-4-deoxy-L-arabinose transferase-like glycosyltransferase